MFTRACLLIITRVLRLVYFYRYRTMASIGYIGSVAKFGARLQRRRRHQVVGYNMRFSLEHKCSGAWLPPTLKKKTIPYTHTHFIMLTKSRNLGRDIDIYVPSTPYFSRTCPPSIRDRCPWLCRMKIENKY